MEWFLIFGAGAVLVWILAKGKAGATITPAPAAETPPAWQTPPEGMPYEPFFLAASEEYQIPAGLLSRVAWQESRYNVFAESPAGAQGIMQFMPATAEDLGVDPYDPAEAINGAARYLKWLYDRTGSWSLALAAYNFGIGNVERGRPWPAETRNYVANITEATGIA